MLHAPGQITQGRLRGDRASNSVSGGSGIGSTYTDADFVRSIRHGVRSSGKPLILMPYQEFYKLSDADLGEIIAYVKSRPPVDNEFMPWEELGLLTDDQLKAIWLYLKSLPAKEFLEE